MPLIRKPSGPGAAPPPAPVEPEAPLSLDRLTAGTPDQRWTAVRAAAERPDSVPLLAAALAGESDARVREAIFTGLARLATTESAAVVVPYIRSDDASLRTAAIDALKAMPQACVHLLPSLLADSDPDVRLLSCELARGLPGAEASRLLCALIDVETEANVCAAAVEVLSETGDRAALPSLARCAERFAADPFLAFSIKAATDRIDSP
jgi:HEAT repeat protein